MTTIVYDHILWRNTDLPEGLGERVKLTFETLEGAQVQLSISLADAYDLAASIAPTAAPAGKIS